MWHAALEKDLKEIFGLKKVLFGTPAFHKEQDVLFCQVNESRNKVRQGRASAIIGGNVSVIGLLGKNNSGYLSKRIALAPASITSRFVFMREEQPVQMSDYEERFNVYNVGFLYFYKEQYNPPSGKITAVDNWFMNIINKIRSKING